jgi:hypothetical protein
MDSTISDDAVLEASYLPACNLFLQLVSDRGLDKQGVRRILWRAFGGKAFWTHSAAMGGSNYSRRLVNLVRLQIFLLRCRPHGAFKQSRQVAKILPSPHSVERGNCSRWRIAFVFNYLN